MPNAPDPGDAKDSAKDDTAPAAATPPDQGSAMELELSQALVELRPDAISGARPRGSDPSYRSSWHGWRTPSYACGTFEGLEPEGTGLAR